MNEQHSKSNRFFSEAERRAMFVAANGICAGCGEPLPSNFHGDHKVPYSKGGETTLDNSQALCPKCNLKKGNSLGVWTPSGITLRAWQIEAFNKLADKFFYKSRNDRRFLAQATPGAGKTIFACAVARHLMDADVINRIMVVSPSTNLRESWADDMARFGIDLDPECGGGKERNTIEFVGKSITYQSLMIVDGRVSGAAVERILQQKSKTLSILDEPHHTANPLSWGKGLQHACEYSEAILSLSGTPFRSDGNPIPFIDYDREGQAVADYVYGYTQALRENPQVCRAVYFPSYEGDLSWMNQSKIYQASFCDELDDELQSQRLRAALWSGEWIESTIREAQSKLSDIRVHHPDAAGLIVAMDKNHARHLARIVQRISLSEPLVVTSDDPEASAQIKAFRNKSDPWVIAVKMISEGVDIKRLRVCVYLSNVITDLFFRQVVGRIVRYIPNIPDQEAYFYIPADKRLVDMAMRFRDERIQGLFQESDLDHSVEDRDFDQGELWGWDELPTEIPFKVLNGESWHESTIAYDGDTFSPEELIFATSFAAEKGYKVAPEVMAKMLRDFPAMRGDIPVNGAVIEPEVINKPAYQKHREVKQSLMARERKLINELIERWFPGLPIGDGFKKVNGGLKRMFGEKQTLTIDQVRQRHESLVNAVMSTEKPSWL